MNYKTWSESQIAVLFSIKNNFIFYKLAKNAGTSFKYFFNEKVPDIKYLPYGQFITDKNIIDFRKNAYEFFITRNTYDRVVSLFKYLVKIDRKNEIFHKNISFIEFLSKIDPLFKLNYNGGSKSNMINRVASHIIPQTTFNCDNFHLHNLNNHMPEICDNIGLSHCKIKKLNTTTHANYKEYYDDKSIEMVNNIYGEEIKKYNFEI